MCCHTRILRGGLRTARKAEKSAFQAPPARMPRDPSTRPPDQILALNLLGAPLVFTWPVVVCLFGHLDLTTPSARGLRRRALAARQAYPTGPRTGGSAPLCHCPLDWTWSAPPSLRGAPRADDLPNREPEHIAAVGHQSRASAHSADARERAHHRHRADQGEPQQRQGQRHRGVREAIDQTPRSARGGSASR
jgi:hypothetical protein